MEYKELRKIIITRINEAVGRSGKSIAQIARDAEIEPTMIYNYTTITRKGCIPSALTLVNLADALDVSVDWLCGREGT